MKRITYFLTILILLVGFPNIVNATTTIENGEQFNVCLEDKYFQVVYDKNRQAVTKDMIIIDPTTGKPTIDKTKYPTSDAYAEFTSLDSICHNVNNTIILCPENGSDYTYDNIKKAYFIVEDEKGVIKTTDKLNNNIEFKLEYSTGKFTIKIKDEFHDKVYVRYQTNVTKINGNNQYNDIVYNFNDINKQDSKMTLQRTADGYYQISNISSQTPVYLEFYVKDNTSGCAGDFIGYISFFTPSISDYTVDITQRREQLGCRAVVDFKIDGMSEVDKQKLSDIKKNYISECYTTESISYGYYGPNGSILKETIAKKLNNLKSMFSSYLPATANNTDNYCTDVNMQGPKITLIETGKYWSIVCTESYEAQGDDAKLVRAGAGFSYQTNYKLSRQCTITSINTPTKPPQCHYWIGHHCSWPTRSGIDTGNDGGPNGTFDTCIMQCDNGKYSQECINSCYKSVYNKERNLSVDNSILKKEGRIVFTSEVGSSTYTSANSTETCQTDHHRPGHKIYHNFHNQTDWACFSDNYCANHGGSCTFEDFKEPDGCSDNADAEYDRAVAEWKSELATFQDKQTVEIAKGNYTYQITDSYLKTSDNKSYVYTVNSKEDPMVKVNKIESQPKSNTSSLQELRIDENNVVSYYATVTKEANITVELPLSYLSRNGGNAIYKNSENDKKIFVIDHQNNTIKQRSDFNLADYYHETNERKYYTSIYSGNKNVVQTDDGSAIMLVSRNNANVNVDYNILVTSSGVGAGEFGSDIKCYYGVYNDFIVPDDPDDYCTDPPCPTITPPPTPTIPPSECTNPPCPPLDQSGIQYIYRDIDLTDVFPNERNPRWNWTSGAASVSSKNQLKYDIDPIKLTKEIESKGESIYDVQKDASEVDYEFVLTKENLKNIRAYNKRVRDYNGDGANNHLDFNMSCYTNSQGKNVCSSRFLDNIDGNSGSESSSNFITYSVSNFTIDARKNLIGCNNSKNLQCNDTYH